MKTKKVYMAAALSLLLLFVTACGSAGGNGTNGNGSNGAGGTPAATEETPAATEEEPGAAEETEAAAEERLMQEAADYYKGASMELIIPYGPGGGFDQTGRAVAAELEKRIGATMIPRNIQGSSPLLGVNELLNSKPDGLKVGLIGLGALVLESLSGEGNLAADLNDISYIARIADDPRLVYVAGDNDTINSWEDVMNSEKELLFGDTSPFSVLFWAFALMKDYLDIPFRLVGGYPGGNDVKFAVMNGELDISTVSLSGRMGDIQEGLIKPLLVWGGDASDQLPDVPNLTNYLDEGNELHQQLDFAINTMNTMGSRFMIAPPGVPQHYVDYLDRTLESILNDPAVVEEWSKVGLESGYLSGKELQEISRAIVTEIPQQFIDTWKRESENQ